MKDVLIVEDDAVLQEALADTIKFAGYSCVVANNGLHALELLDKHQPSLILSDIRMDQLDGKGLLAQLQLKRPEIPVILMTAYGSIEDAVNAIKSGAVDYIQKPFSAESLLEKVNRYLKPTIVDDEVVVAVNSQSKALFSMAKKVSESDVNVLISGESGTGKEVLAQYIHQHSKRANKPFVAINCAAIPEQMLEATLFGYEKGAFTGAYKTTAGKFEQAQAGSLLLDEVSEMSLPLQAKLLRVLQEKEVERLGGNKLIDLDVRVIATTNRQLLDEVKAGRFREDLFYRLNVFPLQCLPLRERKEDIIPLAFYMIRKHCNKNEPIVPALSSEAEQSLLAYSWPGNTRELENVIQRAMVIQSQGVINPEHLQLPTEQKLSPEMDNIKKDLQSHEFDLIEQALKANNGNRTQTANSLGVSERTLRYKLAKMREEGYVI